MSLAALAITATLQSLDPAAGMVSCTFPATTSDERAIRVAVEAKPSLMDFGARFRILLHLSDELEAVGLAQPIERTDARDVLISAKSPEVIYTIGLRDDGRAALNLLHVEDASQKGRNETRHGACHDYKGLMNAWLRS